MATTEQRSGFRLPWASESSADSVRDASSDDAANDVDGGAESRPESTAGEAAPANGPGHEGGETAPSDDPRNLPWPSSDKPHPAPVPSRPEAGPAAAQVTEASPTPPRERHPAPGHTNALVTGLLRVMKDAAEAARQEALASFAELAKTRAEEIRADSTGASQEIRRISDEDIAEIREWSKAQMVRIRQEADDRIAARRRQLEAETEAHAARVERRITTVQDAVGKYEKQMAAFFESLMAETDPAGLAGFAELMPDPPDLSTEGLDDDDTWASAATLDPDAAAAAEAAALAGLDFSDLAAADDTATSSTPAAEASGEPAPDAAESRVTQLSVVGLISVASIAAFKRAIARAAGVDGVSVASGPSGEFEFTVRHADTVDLKAVVAQLEGFDATVTNQKKGVLSVTASEPAEAG